MSRFYLIWLLCCAALLLSGCGPSAAPAGPLPALSLIGMGLGLGDLVGYFLPDGSWVARTGEEIARRVEAYLKEIAAGYAKEIRFDLGRVWGPRLLESAYPVIREQGFKVVAILSPGKEPPVGEIKLEEDIAWLRVALPKVKEDCLAFEFWNEPANPKIGNTELAVPDPPTYIAWHNAIAKVVRELAPGLPILGPSVMGKWSWAWWEAVRDLIDYDIVNSHLYGAGDLYGPSDKPTWVTEAGNMSYWRPWHAKYFLYVWNSAGDQWAKRPGGGILPG